ncbi:hypothetical protein MMC14_008782 [Varicellaria rhodocarpa]|nr:hypothetical protein [Varicellaria rhodocarpa]
MLRTAKISGQLFQSVVGVSHSLGSGLTKGVTINHIGTASTATQIANTDPSGSFNDLANGYFVPVPVSQTDQFAFYRYPFNSPQSKFYIESSLALHPSNLAAVFNSQLNIQTISLGEISTLIYIYTPSPGFTGPVDIVDEQNDFSIAVGIVHTPQTSRVQPAFYSTASKGSQSYLVPNYGHSIKAHYFAPMAFNSMIWFLKTNNID